MSDTAKATQSEAAPGALAGVPERGSADHLLRLLQQHHVQLSTMADTKASMIITVSSIVLTLALGRAGDPEFRLALLVLAVFTMLALLAAILTVLPKFGRVKRLDGPLPPGFNMLFFGHFSALDQDRFLAEMATRMMPGKAYESVLRDGGRTDGHGISLAGAAAAKAGRRRGSAPGSAAQRSSTLATCTTQASTKPARKNR
jgi:hypothetical protein